MKRTKFFKLLVDLLYYAHFAGLLGIFFVLPFGIVKINQVNARVENWDFFNWFIAIVSFVSYIIFLRGLYFLKNMAKHLLSEQYFSQGIIQNLKKSGLNFIYSSSISLFLVFATFTKTLFQNKFELIYDDNLINPLFIMIIGIFLIIQSKSLLRGKELQDENELTV